MTTRTSTHFLSQHGPYQAGLYLGTPLVVLPGLDPDDLPRSFPVSSLVADAVSAALSGANRLYNWHENKLLYHRGRWVPLRNQFSACEKLQKEVLLALCLGGPFPWQNPQVPGGADNPRDSLRRTNGIIVCDDFPLPLARFFSEPDTLSSLPSVAGLLHHPFAGQSRDHWLTLDQGGSAPDPDSLRALFSAFDLPSQDHCALYTYLFACLHAVSLDYPRPLLLVDSYQRGRGKSEVGQVIQVLLDGQFEELVHKDRDTMNEELLARLGEGKRTILLDNLDQKRSFNSTFLASLSTGKPGGRRKYSAANEYWGGTIGLLNTVLGSCSLHPDLLERIWRVQLHGPSRPLHPRPIDLARQCRSGILAAGLHALELARDVPYSGHVHSRFAEFERVGAGAYCLFFNLQHEEVEQLLKNMLNGRRFYLTEAVSSLHNTRAELFEGFHAPLSTVNGRPLDLTGAQAFGLTHNGKEWIN